MEDQEDNKKDFDDLFNIDNFDIEIGPDEPVYTLSVICKLLDMHYWTVHDILEEGLLSPKKTGKRKKLFSHKDIKRLKYIKYLIEDRGVNINGIKVIFEMRREE
ncbi:MAG: MerR family transcriptional regulator [Candidatus Omnitrophota bacterium]